MQPALSADFSPLVLVVVSALLLARAVSRRDLGRRAIRVMGFGLFSVFGGLLWALAHSVATAWPALAVDPGNPCAIGQTARTFNVSLINIPIFLNRYGDVVPEGRMYVLDENIATVRATFANAANPMQADKHDLIEPLTIRANLGDCIQISFTNRLNEPAPSYVRNNSIFPLPGETVLAPGTVTPLPRQYAPSALQPQNDFDPTTAPPASMHFDGLDYDVVGSDGTVVGNNPDTTALPGQTVTYRLFAQAEGEFQFKDGADFSSRQTGAGRFIGSHAFGAFGAVVVEPKDATWVDSRTGAPLSSGTQAVIKDPNGPDFREHVLFMHDEVEAEPGILTRFCRKPSDGEPAETNCVQPTADQLAKLTAGTLPGLSGGDADALVNGEVPVKLEWFAFNYRSEPGFDREEIGCPAATATGQGFAAEQCIGEETSLSSWPYGDPGGGDLVIPNYRGEPMQIRLLHPAELETHTFHWHINRWPFDPKDEGGIAQISNPKNWTAITNPLDVQAISPGTSYQLVPEGGAGSAYLNKPATFGDVIFHCHLYPHFANGMWGLNRTLDKLEDGTRKNPDGSPVPALYPLPDFDYQPTVTGTNPPPAPTATKPGFPNFIPGAFGFKAPKAPLSVPERTAGGVFPPTTLEQAASDPGAQVPGGYFQDPCPAGSPTKEFNVAAIQLDAVYNDDLKWHNPQARAYVLQEDKDAILSGQKRLEPFAPILNVGDCVVYHLTNELPRVFGGNVFDRQQITNEVGIHQHMVLFDVLSSDGTANGWNYDQGADTGQTITYRDFVQDNFSTNSFHDHFFPNVHQDNGLWGGSSIHPPGCTPRLPSTSDPLTPPKVGTIFDVICTPTLDYRGRATDGQDYRNFSLFVEDRVPMFQPDNPNTTVDDPFVTPDGVPIHPAKFPSSPDDSGVMGVNYRLEPFEARRNGDPANLFDSGTWGDPYTPLLRANAGDRTKFRLFQLSQEESHGFNLDRFRWKFEPRDPESNIVQAQHIGMLEYFDLNVPMDDLLSDVQGAALMRDYMWYFGAADDWFLGAWGLLRASGCSNPPKTSWNLRPLPDNSMGTCPVLSIPDNGTPPDPGQPCPSSAPIKSFAISAINKDITYNKAGDHDPNGLMYALDSDLKALAAGTKAPEPLVIRANEGDCVEVTLTNRLDPLKMKPHCFEALEPGQLGFVDGVLTYPSCVDRNPHDEVNVPGFEPFPVSARVSMRPQLVNHHEYSSGSHVGLNVDSTIAPGASTMYRWYLQPGVTGMALLQDMADVQNHLHHGLYGALVIEPAGSSYYDPSTGAALASGQSAVVVNPSQPDFRENIVLMNSDLSLFRKDTNGNPADDLPVPDNNDLSLTPSRQADDPEDQGEFSINYRNEPWSHRYARNQNLALIFSSVVHGDPSTPLFAAYGGDNTWFRVGQAVGDARSTSFALHDHLWRESPADPQSRIEAAQGRFNPGVVYNIHLDPQVNGGAGGRRGVPGDYLYRSGTLMRHLTGGQWGIFRVFGSGRADLVALPDQQVVGAPVVVVPGPTAGPSPASIPNAV
jgi:manganese oxidase